MVHVRLTPRRTLVRGRQRWLLHGCRCRRLASCAGWNTCSNLDRARWARSPALRRKIMTADFPRATPLACVAAAVGLCLSAGAVADLPTESVSISPPLTAKNRVYIGDVAINYIADGKLHIVDTDTGKYLGVVGSGFAGQYVVNPDARE